MRKSDIKWINCPTCNDSNDISYIGEGLFEWIGLSIFGELAMWIIAGVIMIFFSVLNIETAFSIALLVILTIAILYGEKIPWFKCENCNKWYSCQELKEYNKSLQSDAPKARR